MSPQRSRSPALARIAPPSTFGRTPPSSGIVIPSKWTPIPRASRFQLRMCRRKTRRPERSWRYPCWPPCASWGPRWRSAPDFLLPLPFDSSDFDLRRQGAMHRTFVGDLQELGALRGIELAFEGNCSIDAVDHSFFRLT